MTKVDNNWSGETVRRDNCDLKGRSHEPTNHNDETDKTSDV